MSRHVVAKRGRRRNNRPRRPNYSHWLVHHDRIRQRDKIAVGGLDFGVEQIALGNSAHLVGYLDEITWLEAADRAKHDSGHCVGDNRLRRDGERTGNDEPEERESKVGVTAVGQQENDCEKAEQDKPNRDELGAKVCFGFVFCRLLSEKKPHRHNE